MMEDLLIKFVLAAVMFFGVLNLAGLHTWIERKQSAIIQDRIGANRASILGFTLMGLFHPLADAVKMFTKEDIIPAGANKVLHTLAPASRSFSPRGICRDPVRGPRAHRRSRDRAAGRQDRCGAPLHLGDACWASTGHPCRLCVAENYALLGGLRATAQMISYEVAPASRSSASS